MTDTSTPHPLDLTSPGGVQAVIGQEDPVLRNLQITQSYHELTVALDEHFGGLDLSWPAFATWASKQAGTFIRNEEVPPPLIRFLEEEPNPVKRLLAPGCWLKKERFRAYARLTAADVSTSIAAGNHLVYTKLAPLFAGFLALAGEDRLGDDGAWSDFTGSMEREPATGEALPRAFESFRAARSEADTKRRAERICLGNVLVGWHEQARLQEALDGALGAPVRRALEDPERKWSRLPMPAAARRLGAATFRLVLAPAIRHLESDWRCVATECLMTLGLPEGRLALGDDVPPLPDGRAYPEALDPLTLEELVEVTVRLDRAPATLTGSGAKDWTSLDHRMNYIADLFRSRQQVRDLLQPPFSPEQITEIRAGRVPAGRL